MEININQDYSQFYKTRHNRVVWQVGYWCRYADAVITQGDYIEYLPYWNYARNSVICVDSARLKPDPDFQFNIGKTVHIVHAPNHMAVKGSAFIEEAIQRLIEEGYRIQYDCLHGKSNDEVLETVKNADIVVDQLIIGWHGIFAVEAMAFGKPVIARTREDLLRTYEEIGCLKKGEMPLIDARPTTIYDVLKNLLDHPETWEDIGRKSRIYVEKHHSIEIVGKFFDVINRKIGIMPVMERNM